jgi:hypothetical protein
MKTVGSFEGFQNHGSAVSWMKTVGSFEGFQNHGSAVSWMKKLFEGFQTMGDCQFFDSDVFRELEPAVLWFRTFSIGTGGSLTPTFQHWNRRRFSDSELSALEPEEVL